MDRIACALIPHYELAILARTDPGLWDRPLAVADLAESPTRLGAVTRAAEALGARTGMLVRHARAQCPELILVTPDARARAAAEHEILSLLTNFSPLVDTDGRGAFFASLRGLEMLVPNEHVFARDLQEALRQHGFEAGIALADGAFVAWVAAQRARRPTLVERGGDATFLETVPLTSLSLSEPAYELLTLLGVRTAGEVAALPPGALARRLGPEGARIERLYRGTALFACPSSAKAPREPERVRLVLDLPLEDREPLLFLFKSLLDRLLARLGRTHHALAELTIRVDLDDRSQVNHRLTPASPTLDGRSLLELVRLWLGEQPFAAGVSALELVATGVGGADPRQLGLLRQREERAHDALRHAVTRLVAAFGAARVLRPVLTDTYRPEQRLRWEPFGEAPSAHPAPLAAASPGLASPSLALRLVDPPEPIRWQGRRLHRPQTAPVAVRTVEGPSRLSGEWWEAPFDRSYFWVETVEGALLWIFRDERDSHFYLQGVAD